MFPIQCNDRHETSFKVSCCINHLIEMYFFAENQTLRHKYAKLLTLTLNHHFKRNQINFDKIKLETAKIFLEILTQYISYYFCLNKLDLAKLLTKIALMICEDVSRIKNSLDPEIIKRKCAVYNNLSCIYEKFGKYSKSVQYLKSTYKLMNRESNQNKTVDMAIFYNNLARISLKQKEMNVASQAMKMSYELFREGSFRLIQEKYTHNTNGNYSVASPVRSTGNEGNSQNTLRLYGFLYLNYGVFLSNFAHHSKDMVAVDVFLQGYEYCKSVLNEHDEIFSKLRYKLQVENNSTKIIKKNTFRLEETLDSKYDSDAELPQIITRSLSNKMKKSKESLEKNNDYANISTHKSHNNRMLTNHSSSTTNYDDMNEIKSKVDQLLNKFEEFKRYASTPPILKKTSNEVNFEGNLKKKPYISPKYEALKTMIMPQIRRLISDVNSESASQISQSRPSREVSSITKKSTNFTEEFLQELVNEFESNKEFNASKDSIKINDVNRSRSSRGSLIVSIKTENNQQKNNIDNIPNEMLKGPVKPKRKLKDMLSKAIPEETLKNLNSISTATENGKIFTNLVNSLINDDENIFDNLRKSNSVSELIKTENIKDLSSKNVQQFKEDEKRNSLVKDKVSLSDNNLPEKREESTKSLKTLPHVNERTIDSKITITIAQDEGESNDKYEAKTYYTITQTPKETIELKNSENKKKEDKEAGLNSDVKSSDMVDNYHATSLTHSERISSNGNLKEDSVKMEIKPELKRYATSYTIKVELDEEESLYKPKTYYRKREPKSDLNRASSVPIGKENLKSEEIKNLNVILENANEESFNTDFTPSFINTTFNENQQDSTITKSQEVVLKQEVNLKQDDLTATKSNQRVNFISSTTNKGIRKMITLDDFHVENEILTKRGNPSKTKLLQTKKKKENDFKKHIDNLMLIYKSSIRVNDKKTFTIIRELENSLYKIALSIDKNDKRDIGLQFRLHKENSSEILNQSFITFEKIKNSESKLNLHNSLSTFDDLFNLPSIEDFIRKTLIYNCHLHKTDKSLLIGLLTRPIGLCANNLYEFTFLNTLCFIDILIKQSTEIKFIIYSKKNDNISAQFDLIVDEAAFKTLFRKYDNEKFPNVLNEILMDSYHPLDERHMTKDGLIADIIVLLEKYLFGRFTKLITKKFNFEDVFAKLSTAVFKLIVKEDFRNLELWSIFFEESRESDTEASKDVFSVDFLNLKPIQAKNEKVKLKLHHAFNNKEFKSIFGFEDFKTIKEFLSDRDKIKICSILLNSVQLNYNLEQIENMTKSDIKKNLKIISSIPQSLFKFSCTGNGIININNNLTEDIRADLEFIFYNKFCYFYRLSLHNNLESVVKILKKEFDSEKNINIDSYVNSLEYSLPINENQIELTKCITQYQKFISDSETFSLFDTLENLIHFS